MAKLFCVVLLVWIYWITCNLVVNFNFLLWCLSFQSVVSDCHEGCLWSDLNCVWFFDRVLNFTHSLIHFLFFGGITSESLQMVLHNVDYYYYCPLSKLFFIIANWCSVWINRHELPVTADPVEILAETDELLVVNKPSSIPIHPCGRYRFNCLLYILAKENGLRHLRGKVFWPLCFT